jgi:hypothetical protein
MAIEVELYTIDHVIRGFIEMSGERMSDVLNLKTELSLTLTQAQVSRLLNVAKDPPMRLPVMRIEKSSLLFALPVERDLTHKSLYRRAVRQGYEIFVSLPNFELQGTIHLTERLDIRRVLVVRPEDFIPLTDAMATYVLYPQVTLQGSTIVFNKSRVIFAGERPSVAAAPPA